MAANKLIATNLQITKVNRDYFESIYNTLQKYYSFTNFDTYIPTYAYRGPIWEEIHVWKSGGHMHNYIVCC